MARKKNIHEDYSEVKFIFANTEAQPMTIRSTLTVKEKSLYKSIYNHEAWQKDKKKITTSNAIKERYDIDL